MTSVWDPSLAAISDGGDYDCIIDNNVCVKRVFFGYQTRLLKRPKADEV